MAFQPCPETAEIRIQGSLFGQQVENVLHCRISTTPSAAELAAVLSAVNDWVLGPYSTHQPNVLRWSQIVVTDLNVPGGLQAVQDLSGDGGLGSDTVKTNQDTFCIKLLTGHSGRSFRGRFYWLAIALGAYDSSNPNMVSVATQNIMVTDLDTLRIDMNTASHPLGILSRYNTAAVPTPPHKRATGLLTNVTSVTSTDRIIDSQNRRLPGRGL